MSPRPQRRGGRLTPPGRGHRSGLQPAEEGDGVAGANGDLVTAEEAAAILTLNRLAARWPQTLTLISMGGVLHVIRTADERFGAQSSEDRAECVLATIHGIPNDGGGW